MLTQEEVVPALAAVFGLSVCLFGGRFTRLYAFVLGCALGTSFTYWYFGVQLEARAVGVPLVVGLMVTLLSGMVLLLSHMLTIAFILGYTAASMLIVLDNGLFLTYYRTVVYLLVLAGAVYFTFSRPALSQQVTTAASGALLVVLCVDSWSTRSLGALIFQDTFLEYSLGVESAVARCFTWKCWLLLPSWAALTCMGFVTQHWHAKLRAYEARWPLLFQAPKKANFSSSSSSRARGPEAAAADGLIAEDRNYAVSNYASYDSFLKLSTANAAQAQQASAAQAAASSQARGVPSAHPELGSAHADDKATSAPAQRASYNFIELKRLPASQHYLYLVVHHAFTSQAAAFGFQQDNVNNQYEHLLFLLINFQNKPTSGPGSAAATAGPNAGIAEGSYQSASAGAPAGGATPILNGDAISQLHARLFSNYREWIRYMNLGGNSTLGGSAISSELVATVKSNISPPQVDRNTTDAKIEEICLWLLVWGEGGTLRHTPECLLYLFHNMAGENRRFHARQGGAVSLEDVSAPASASASSGKHLRPRRNPGDFLQLVVKPLYDVVASESSKAGGRNYDDFNEFFWRTEVLDYYYADFKYRVAEAPMPTPPQHGQAARERDIEDPPSLRSSTTVAQALKVSKKSFLEKRSWLHPLRSFMRLMSFYFVSFHLLVCIAYIHYANLPFLSRAANNILASFVVSLAGWSFAKEVFELWATYGIVQESVWNAIGFLMRGAIKLSMFVLLATFYTWSMENTNPVVAAGYADAYLILACAYLVPAGVSLLCQLFPRLATRILGMHIPFADEMLKFWYPIQKLYVGRDVHEGEKDIYRYQLFWVLLLGWKMYCSLLFQISPLIQPSVDILAHIDTLSISTHTWQRWLCYGQIAVLWTPFVLVYMFDTIIWYFLWQAVWGLLVGMREHLGEIRAFPELVKAFTLMPAQFDAKIVYNPHKKAGAAHGGAGALAAQAAARGKGGRGSAHSSPSSTPAPVHPRTSEAASLLSISGGQPVSTPRASGALPADNLAQPLTMSRARRGSIGSTTAAAAAAAAAAVGGPSSALVPADPFRNVAWENFAVVWGEIIEDLRLGDLISNQERHMLRFRFDTTSVKEYYLPLFLLVGHIDDSVEHCMSAQREWQACTKSSGGLDGSEKAKLENQLVSYLLTDNSLRAECLSEVWEHVCWLLINLLGERHAASLNLTFGKMSELLLGHRHVLRGTNLSALPKLKNDLLNLVRGLRIASASFATLKLQEAEKRSAAEREREEQFEMQREDSFRRRLEEQAEAEEEEEEGGASDPDDHDSDDESHVSSKQARASRKRLLQDVERSTQQRSTLARAREFNLKSLVKSPSMGTLAMLEHLSSRPRHRSAVPVGSRSGNGGLTSHAGSFSNLTTAPDSSSGETGYLILHISLIRDQLSALLNSLVACFNPRYNAELDPRDVSFHHGHGHGGAAHPAQVVDVAKDIIGAIKHIHITNEGFMWDGAYAGAQIHALLSNARTNTVLTTMHSLLTVAAVDVEPKSLEATRRLLFFSNSLFMQLPVAPSVRSSKSLSTLTPFHSEDIIYSFADLQKRTEDGVSVFFYLQTVYPLEWQNFLERCGISEDEFHVQGSQILSASKKHNLEARLWATSRGQTLGRTVDGMMLYEKALRLLLKLEEPDPAALKGKHAATGGGHELDDHDLLVQTKYNYLVTAQIYGKQKRENDPKALDIEFLLHRHPSVRVAYIDTVKVPYVDPLKNPGQTLVREEYFSVLIKSERNPATGASEIKEVYRIQLPGNPVLGEGKPENQNHALIFARGEFLQAIDMNQSNYFEEAIKMRNLLEEFDGDDPSTTPDRVQVAAGAAGAAEQAAAKRVAIVGFREHIYTGGLSSIANFMALQEGTFVTQGQRVLDNPLRVRFHYGHPDCFDKLFFMSRGGISKASRGINLSEDIFAGFNSVLRGGAVRFREYIQVGKGRDVGLQQLFKFEAKLSQGNSMQSISRDIYRLANTVDFFRLCSFFFGGVGFYITNCLTIWALYVFIYSRLILAGFRLESLDSFSGADTISYWFGMIGFLLTLPVFATIGLERGFRRSAMEVIRLVLTGGPVYYLFMIGTKSYYFEQTMLAGGAKYRPTGRGFVTRHEHFAEIYRFHAASHFYRSVEMMIALLLYIMVIPPTYSYSLVTWAGWLIVGSWFFGPFWFNPLGFEWEKTVVDFDDFSAWMNRREGDGDKCWRAWWKDENSYLDGLSLSTRVMLAVMQLRYVVVGVSLLYFVGASRQQTLIAGLILAAFLCMVVFVRAHHSLAHQFALRLVKAVLVLAAMMGLFALISVYTLTPYEWLQYLISIAALTYVFHACCNSALALGLRTHWLMQWFKLVDWSIAGSLFVVLTVLSVTVLPSIIQTRLMFHNAFSRGVLIDKLLKSKPDDDSGTGGAGGAVAAAKFGRGRRKDARAGRDEDRGDSPDDEGNGTGTSAAHGFDLQAISFIEKRSSSKKKLHPSKKETDDEPPAQGGMTRTSSGRIKGNVTFGGVSSSGGAPASSAAAPSHRAHINTDLSQSIQEESPDYTPSPHLHPAVLAAGAASPGSGSPAMHLPVSALQGRPIPSTSFSVTGSPAASSLSSRNSILASMGGSRSASDGAALSPSGLPPSGASGPSAAGGQPMAFPPTVVIGSGLPSRQGSGQPYSPVVAAAALPGSHSGSAASLHSASGGTGASNSPRTSSPAPGSPSMQGLALGGLDARTRASKLVGLGTAAAPQDERPIPRTIAPQDLAKQNLAVAKSPLNPRRAP